MSVSRLNMLKICNLNRLSDWSGRYFNA